MRVKMHVSKARRYCTRIRPRDQSVATSTVGISLGWYISYCIVCVYDLSAGFIKPWSALPPRVPRNLPSAACPEGIATRK